MVLVRESIDDTGCSLPIAIPPEVFRALAAGSIAKYSSARALKTLIFSSSILALKGSINT